jgi:hypothetical protein
MARDESLNDIAKPKVPDFHSISGRRSQQVAIVTKRKVPRYLAVKRPK